MSAPRKQYRKGDPARNFAADDYNAIAAEVERWSNLKAIAPLAIGDGPGGRYLTRDGEPSFYAKLSGASSPYAWTEQVETASGVWANGERTGTDAYEVNSRASLNNKIARLYPTAFDHRFRFIRAGGTTGPVPTICGCGTVPAPTSITVTPSLTAPFGGYAACIGGPGVIYMPTTLTWQPIVSGTTPIPTTAVAGAIGTGDTITFSAGGYCYLSPLGMFEPHRRYILGCYRYDNSGGVPDYAYSLYFYNGTGGTTSFTPASAIYTWSKTGTDGNTCSPFYYKNGVVGYSACVGSGGNRIYVELT